MDNKKLRVGIVGCGRISVRHFSSADTLPEAELVACCDLKKSNTEKFAKQYGVKEFSDYKEMIASPDIDAIVVATPTQTHFPILMDCIATGKPIFCEKPLTFTTEEAEKIEEAVAETGVYLQVGFMRRYDPGHVAAKKMISEGKCGKPIYFQGTGEKLEDLEAFYPARMSSRILGMGDVLSLIEKAQDAFDLKEAEELKQKLRKDEFTLDDFLKQMKQVRKLGSFEQILGMIPGLGSQVKDALKDKDIDLNGKEMRQIEAIILAMTPEERAKTKIINGSRRKRIAKGSGTRVQDVNKLLKQFDEMQKMVKRMKKMQNGKKGGLFGGMKLPFMH